jgi:hypothetical protein
VYRNLPDKWMNEYRLEGMNRIDNVFNSLRLNAEQAIVERGSG